MRKFIAIAAVLLVLGPAAWSFRCNWFSCPAKPDMRCGITGKLCPRP